MTSHDERFFEEVERRWTNAPDEDAFRMTGLMAQLIEDQRGDLATILVALHDALMLHARLEAEHDPFYKMNATATIAGKALHDERERAAIVSAKNRINRMNFLAHELTKARVALEDFDRKYPR